MKNKLSPLEKLLFSKKEQAIMAFMDRGVSSFLSLAMADAGYAGNQADVLAEWASSKINTRTLPDRIPEDDNG